MDDDGLFAIDHRDGRLFIIFHCARFSYNNRAIIVFTSSLIFAPCPSISSALLGYTLLEQNLMSFHFELSTFLYSFNENFRLTRVSREKSISFRFGQSTVQTKRIGPSCSSGRDWSAFVIVWRRRWSIDPSFALFNGVAKSLADPFIRIPDQNQNANLDTMPRELLPVFHSRQTPACDR